MIEAVYAKPMHWFGAASIFLNNIGKRSGIDLLEAVFFLFSVPCFKFSEFFFKLVYSAGESRLRVARTECLALSRQDQFAQLDHFLLHHRGVAYADHGLCDVESGSE